MGAVPPADRVWGLPLAVLRWSIALPGAGSFRCSAPLSRVGAHCWLWWRGSSPFLAEGNVVVVPCHSWLGRSAPFTAVIPRYLWR